MRDVRQRNQPEDKYSLHVKAVGEKSMCRFIIITVAELAMRKQELAKNVAEKLRGIIKEL